MGGTYFHELGHWWAASLLNLAPRKEITLHSCLAPNRLTARGSCRTMAWGVAAVLFTEKGSAFADKFNSTKPGWHEALMAAAGPACQVVYGVLWGCVPVAADYFFFRGERWPPMLTWHFFDLFLVGLPAILNIASAAFNLLPLKFGSEKQDGCYIWPFYLSVCVEKRNG